MKQIKNALKKGGVADIVTLIIIVGLVIALIVAIILPIINNTTGSGLSTSTDVATAFDKVNSTRSGLVDKE